MAFIIYTDHSCGHYFLTPLLAIEHLWTSHHTSTSAMQTSFGQAGIETLLSRQTLHLEAPPDPISKRLFACLSCSILYQTSFLAQTHLHTEHQDQVHRTRVLFGNAGVAKLITTVWLVDEAGIPPQQVQHHRASVTLHITIKNYTDRAHYPAEITVTLAVPHGTGTIVELAEILDKAFVAVGGPPDRIGWVDMIHTVGIHLAGQGGGIIDDDAGLVGWLRGAGQVVYGNMNGDGAQ